MTVQHGFWLLIASGHLFLVTCGAFGWGLLPAEWPSQRVLRLYGELTSADSQFGFFAPAVGSQLRTVFVLTDAEGHSWEDTLDKGANRECYIRQAGMTDAAWCQGNVDHAQVASWAAGMLGRHPSAVSVQVCIEAFDVPRMSQYRGGARPSWVPAYSLTYERQDFDRPKSAAEAELEPDAEEP
jgi:hypothetical protein